MTNVWNKLFLENLSSYLNETPAEVYYREISTIRHPKFQNLNVFRLVLQLSLPNLLTTGIKSRMKM